MVVSYPSDERREAAVGRGDAAAVPEADGVPPDHRLQLLKGQTLRNEAVIEQLAFHPGPHTLAACIVVAAPASAVHALADSAAFHGLPVSSAGVLRAPVRVDDGTSQEWIGCHRVVQRP